MHELGITRSVVAIWSEQAKGVPVRRVTLEIGKLSAVMPETLRFCFDVCSMCTLTATVAKAAIRLPSRCALRVRDWDE